MKKFAALLCMLTCIFSLTACGGEDAVNQYQSDKLAVAEQCATNSIIPLMEQSLANETIMDIYSQGGYTAEEWETVIANSFNAQVKGDAFLKALESFENGFETMGAILSIGDVNSVIDDETIIVTVDVTGELKNGQVEMIFSNDYFAVLQSCTLNVDATFGELMTKAALNTLLGMGSVFAVLILIMFIISLFGYIPKIQAMFAKKEEKSAAPAPAPVAAPVVEEAVEEADDLALVAVIAAAIAAYEGQTTTDGFVVRSIKKAKRR